MFATAKTEWVWSEIAESIYPNRKAGTPTYDCFRKTVYCSWVEKGYVVDASTMPGQLELNID